MATHTETDRKLKDASIQLQLAVDHIADEDFFRSCINSFISAARSITMVMERESKKNPELKAWYKTQTKEFAEDSIMQFFNQQRVLTMHLGNVKPRSHSIPLRNVAESDDANQEKVSIWVFDDVQAYLPNETGNVLRMCDHYLHVLEDMVNEWRYLKAVSEDPRDVIEQLQAYKTRLEGEILNLRSELDQSKLNLKILNDMLSNLGDSSQTEWVGQLMLRIDRLLDPEYFQRAPGVKPEGSIARNETGSLSQKLVLISPTEAQFGSEAVYATIRNDYARDEAGNPIFDKEFGCVLWGTNLKGGLPTTALVGFRSATEAEQSAFKVYKTLRY